MQKKRTENSDLDNVSLISDEDGNAGGQNASSADLMRQANLLITGGIASNRNCSGITSGAATAAATGTAHFDISIDPQQTAANGAVNVPVTPPELNKPAVEPLFRDASTLPHQA